MTPEKFWRRVEKSEGCWRWPGAKNSTGYGMVRVGKKVVYAHRYAYELEIGPIPEGLTIDHLCRVRLCVNPAHLEPVTQSENVLRGQAPPALNAVKTHCKRGHEFTEENTGKASSGGRMCIECHRTTNRDRARRIASLRKADPPHRYC